MAKNNHTDTEQEQDPAFEYESFVDLPEHVRNTFQLLLERYEPAAKGDACEHLTTKQIYTEIVEHCGVAFPYQFVSSYMEEHRFISGMGAENEFFWLLKRKR